MITSITQVEKEAIEYADKYKNNWELFIIAKDSFLAGARSRGGPEKVEVEFKNGDHQIVEKIGSG